MSLINCPECNKEISDKVKACPHCGFPMDENEIQKVEVIKKENPEKKRKVKKLIIVMVTVILIIIVGGGVGLKIKNDKLIETQKIMLENYITNYRLTYYAFLSYASDCESITDDVYTVWDQSIDNKYDFNENLRYLYNDNSNGKVNNLNKMGYTPVEIIAFKELVSSVIESDTALQDQIKDLKNPPEKYKSLYDEILVLYEIYQGLSKQAQNPSGNITSFETDVSGIIDSFLKQYNKIEVLLPEE